VILTTLDLQAAGITSVIWANGYGFDYGWVRLPVLDLFGYQSNSAARHGVPWSLFSGHGLAPQPQIGDSLGVGEDVHIAAKIAATDPLAVAVLNKSSGDPTSQEGGLAALRQMRRPREIAVSFNVHNSTISRLAS
jgi:hypothetical protein